MRTKVAAASGTPGARSRWVLAAVLCAASAAAGLAGVSEPGGDGASRPRSAPAAAADGGIDRLEAQLATGPYTAGTLNELGIAYARAGRRGKAVLAWERALRVSPRFEPARRNLARIRKRHDLAGPPHDPLYRYYGRWLAPERWTQLGLGALGLFAFAALLGALPRRWRERLGVTASGRVVALLVALLLVAAVGGWSHERRWQRAAVVTARGGAKLLRSASEHAPELRAVPEGTWARLLRRHGSFVEIAPATGERGWVQRAAIERVIPERGPSPAVGEEAHGA